MLNYFMDDQPITGPLRADGLTLRKERNRKYWGFLYRKLGFVAGTSGLRFEQPDVVALLTDRLTEFGVQAETRFRIEAGGNVLYDGSIDYATWTADGQGVSVGLRDNRAVVDVSAGAATVYGLEPNTQMQLHERMLTGLAGLMADPGTLTIQRSEPGPVAIAHSVPLTRRAETDDTINGTLTPVVSPLALDACYQNTTATAQVVHVQGVIPVTVSSSTNLTAELRVVSGDTVVLVSRVDVTATPTPYRMAIDVRLAVAVGATLRIDWQSTTQTNRWRFDYGADMGVFVQDEKRFGASTAPGMLMLDALTMLVDKSTRGGLGFRSDWLRTGGGFGLMLLNGAGVRGVVRPLSCSLERVFAGLNAIHNLALWVEDDTVRLEPKGTGTASTVSNWLSRTEAVATDFLYSSVKAGYAVWEPGNGLGANEINGQRTYSTEITALRNDLDLISELVTASGVIETQRRKQFDPKTAGSGKVDNLDDTLFLIQAEAVGTADATWRAETPGRVAVLRGDSEPATLYNAGLTPGRNLYRWRDWLSESGRLTTETVQGGDALVTQMDGIVIDDANPLPDLIRKTPKLITLTVPMGLAEYASTVDTLDYDYQGREHSGDVLAVEWRLTNTGEIATITILER